MDKLQTKFDRVKERVMTTNKRVVAIGALCVGAIISTVYATKKKTNRKGNK